MNAQRVNAANHKVGIVSEPYNEPMAHDPLIIVPGDRILATGLRSPVDYTS